jgi:hypothetical protein
MLVRADQISSLLLALSIERLRDLERRVPVKVGDLAS